MIDTTPRLLLAGRILSGVTAVLLLADAVLTLINPPPLQAEMAATGFPLAAHSTVGSMGLVSALLYAVPRTAMLGAILVTGFLGGAICTHFRVEGLGSPPQLVSLALGISAWAGLYLRDARLRALLPLRQI